MIVRVLVNFPKWIWNGLCWLFAPEKLDSVREPTQPAGRDRSLFRLVFEPETLDYAKPMERPRYSLLSWLLSEENLEEARTEQDVSQPQRQHMPLLRWFLSGEQLEEAPSDQEKYMKKPGHSLLLWLFASEELEDLDEQQVEEATARAEERHHSILGWLFASEELEDLGEQQEREATARAEDGHHSILGWLFAGEKLGEEAGGIQVVEREEERSEREEGVTLDDTC